MAHLCGEKLTSGGVHGLSIFEVLWLFHGHPRTCLIKGLPKSHFFDVRSDKVSDHPITDKLRHRRQSCQYNCPHAPFAGLSNHTKRRAYRRYLSTMHKSVALSKVFERNLKGKMRLNQSLAQWHQIRRYDVGPIFYILSRPLFTRSCKS